MPMVVVRSQDSHGRWASLSQSFQLSLRILSPQIERFESNCGNTTLGFSVEYGHYIPSKSPVPTRLCHPQEPSND